jgi:hypothetical protein
MCSVKIGELNILQRVAYQNGGTDKYYTHNNHNRHYRILIEHHTRPFYYKTKVGKQLF